jgi:tripartite-type tricarboxylate transporter receptor subunit TctC
VAARLHAETMAALDTPILRSRMEEHGVSGRPMSSAEFAAFVAEQVRTVGGAVRALGITAG